MTKLNRIISIKFISTNDLLKKFCLEDAKFEVVKKETIKFEDPFGNGRYEKELETFKWSFRFDSYKNLLKTLEDYKQFTPLYYWITDDNEDIFARKKFGECWANNHHSLKLNLSLESYLLKEKSKYEIEYTKPGSKYKVKKVYYWGKEI